MLEIKIMKIREDARIPEYAHMGDAGLDFFCNEDDYELRPMERKGFSTGIKMAIPQGYVGLIWDKSGIAFKYGLKTMAGVIDSTYRGEVVIVVINLSDKNYIVEKHAKLAQMLIKKVESAKITINEDLEETSRGENGFGSTGAK
ncbi:MAG: dUTP diphosphatase [Minisyncoccia bacterium]